MDTEKISEWVQIIGTFGVVASLIFVGLQMKQAQEIAISETYQSRTALTVESNAADVSNPLFLSGLSKLYTNRAAELTSQEAISLEYSMAKILMIMENNHYQYVSGFLSEEHWQRDLDEMRCSFEQPMFRSLIDDWVWRDSFQAVLNNLIAEAKQNPQGCWNFEWDYAISE